MKVVIIGGVAGGASAAARLRRLDEGAEIVLLERGDYISFANCGLPYYIGGTITDEKKLTVQTPRSFHARFNVDVRTRSEAIKLDCAKKLVRVKNLNNGEEYEEHYDALVLSPGAGPVRLPIPGIDHPKVFTIRNIPDTFRIKEYVQEKRPQRALVMGGGFIGLEMAENLAEAGVKVTIAELADHVLASFDYDAACLLHGEIRKHGVDLRLQTSVKEIRENGDGLRIILSNGEVEADMVIAAVGVRPESDIAAAAGITVNKRGCIIVDKGMQTSEKDVYAVGDAIAVTNSVTGDEAYIPLAGPANKQGRIAADRICGIPSEYFGSQGSSIVKVFEMTAASTGISELAARSKGIQYDKIHLYTADHASYYPGAEFIALKLIFEVPSGRVLGAQLTGVQGVDKRCDVLATAIHAGMTIDDLAKLDLCYAPPYSSAKDPVVMAGMAAGNVLSGRLKNFHWTELDTLDRSRVTLLDVRSEGEYSMGHVDGFRSIPLDQLRARMSELEKGKPVYVHCFSGLRSYIACRILSGNGFECHNLSGGYHLYAAMAANK
jgi:NADPH-dependent 2,4-dienoyl-CoA reductase/sulfur reductase-like enzyme/rhodanese-related sulfurtransferase